MPYITKEQQQAILQEAGRYPEDAGELNFILTKLCQEYVNRRGTRYQYMNDVVGALECCKQEFYRRLVGPYEDIKIQENGDLY